MNVKTTISTTEARKRLFDIVEKVSSPATVYTLTERGEPKAVIMSAQEYESWTETFEVMRDFPDLNKDLKKTAKAIKSGAWKNWPTLDDIKREFILRDKPNKNVQNRTPNKRKKKSK